MDIMVQQRKRRVSVIYLKEIRRHQYYYKDMDIIL